MTLAICSRTSLFRRSSGGLVYSSRRLKQDHHRQSSDGVQPVRNSHSPRRGVFAEVAPGWEKHSTCRTGTAPQFTRMKARFARFDYESHGQSTLYRFRSHLGLELWNPWASLWKPGPILCAKARRNRRFPRTLKIARSLRATRRFRSGIRADLRLERTGQHCMVIKNRRYDGLRKSGTC
jgi:hypothetical protein